MSSEKFSTDTDSVKKTFSNKITDLQANENISFDRMCPTLYCNYQKLVNAVSIIYSGADLELIERNIPFVLRNLAEFTFADHVAVSTCGENYKLINQYYEWSSPDVEFLQGSSGKVTTANMLTGYYPFHKAGKDVYISSTEIQQQEYKLIISQMVTHGILSLLSIPLIYNNKTIGTLELYYLKSTTDFQERELSLLRFFACLQANVSQRINHLKKWMADADNYVSRQKGFEKELKQARENAEAAKRIKDTFFVNLSHEIRTPLNIISGMHRELIREKLNSRQKHFLQQSYIASRYLLNLFNNVMDVNDMETGTFHLNQKDFNLQLLMLEVKEMMEGKAMEKRSIDLQIMVDEGIHMAYKGDAQRLQQILIKLISNAFKFTNEGIIRVDVSVQRKTTGFHELIFDVSDTGIGMNNHFIAKIFDKFSREDDSLSRIHEGAGLGLYICYQLTKLMGGAIKVESKPGVGTKFRLTLPFQLGDEKVIEAQQSHAAGYNFRDLRILLVEDNDTNRFIARQTLSHTGCQVIEAINGKEAVELLRNQNADLILMDIQMPVMDGMVATRIIRQELNLKMPIIAFTANAIDSEIAKYMSFGMEDYIVKPYRESELYEKIEKYTHPHETNMKTNTPVEKLYDLSYLNELSQGDESFTRQIIETFIVMAEQSVEQLRVALADQDLVAIRKIAHKIKPTLANFQITSIKGLIDKLNHADAASMSQEELNIDIQKVIQVLITIQTQLKEQLT